MTRTLAPSADLGATGVVLAFAFGAVAVVLLFVELSRSRGGGRRPAIVALTGALATLALVGAILRPVSVESSGLTVGPRVAIVVDGSRSMLLPAGDGEPPRRSLRDDVVTKLAGRGGDVRFAISTFGEGPAVTSSLEELAGDAGKPRGKRSDLAAALSSVASGGEEPPTAIIVVSDGVLDRPSREHAADAANLGLSGLNVPVHSVLAAKGAPKDASLRAVRLAGAAVAHQPFSVRVELGCGGGLTCGRVPVYVRELADEGPSQPIAEGEVDLAGAGEEPRSIELSLTLHRAGPRVIEVEIDAPRADSVPANDRRFVTLDVARDRVRVLHIAGRPTYDVRAMRTWLKADESVDVVAFFILRTPTDSVGAPASELALIPFPVDELFTTHLPSFDAVVLQDFNAATYGLTRHLDNLTDYVKRGGGLIMVGGPDAFGPGMYADTPLAAALPVKLERAHTDNGVDLGFFTPQVTPAGRVAPVLGPVRELIGEGFPDMPGTNIVGAPNPGATVLLTHPTLGSDERMPVLALGEYGTGRTIALTVDGTHKLLFGTFAAERAGRAYGALWDGLLGWLMRDPRFESTALDLPGGCIAGEPSTITIRPLPGHTGEAAVSILQLGTGKVVFEGSVAIAPDGVASTLELPSLDAGGYAASVRLGPAGGADDPGSDERLTPATRRDFACEEGGDEWADSRPDGDRLAAIAKATRGISVGPDDLDKISFPDATVINTQRRSAPLAPAWVWTTFAAALVGAHWVLRRRAGLS
ncbi:MAG: hypothetical protein IPM79_16090 [Polyangiaceae bacterium]|nr:hypothetical protein [Polyangiaceae bacterium]MBK8939099.1 hypothetical protein [Polyangiaceae bacterium]